eukprot:TRINITY_DN4742_c0_g1_i4.p1 TRINITY_DN4742_c0_g1~~TRINITY_DN4742_c0_g1_i4.p1  ORF type:complete len:808 (-),score=167.44 TRINITY_DN4742_c0_g1_i4:424-2784(-)
MEQTHDDWPTSIPHAAWRRRLDDEFELHKEFEVDTLEGISLLGLAWRMFNYIQGERKAFREPFMDPFASKFRDAIMGVPLGGIGGGTIGRGWRGDFVRWTLVPAAIPHLAVVDVNQFSVRSRNVNGEGDTIASVLHAPAKKTALPKPKLRSQWNFGLKGDKSHYYGLFPQAWTVYDGEPDAELRLTCHQVSPVIPHDYEVSSFPTCVFHWTVENKSTVHDKEVSLMFTFQNGTGGKSDSAGGHKNEWFQEGSFSGIKLVHDWEHKVHPDGTADGELEFNDPVSFSIATNAKPSNVSYTTKFESSDPRELQNLWTSFSTTGQLDNSNDKNMSNVRSTIAAALCVKEVVPKGGKVTITFSLSWDCPIARFSLGKAYYRRYTRFYGKDGTAALHLSKDSLNNYPKWISRINSWQEPILRDKRLSRDYCMALFNELYYIVDGGTIWTDGPTENPGKEISDPKYMGQFFYLEGHEYLMCNTYDVHFYASFALIMLWPELQLSLQRDISLATAQSIDQDWFILHDGATVKRLVEWCVPHDLGNPGEDPWIKPNTYNIQQIQRWKDLNCKFVLQAYRDYVATKNKTFLSDMWPTVKKAIEYCAVNFDKDRDGMIENEGFPDQTYDTWAAVGISAYCGGLWVATLKVARAIAYTLNDKGAFVEYDKRYKVARDIYCSKLWNGSYFNYDTSNNLHHDSIQADMMAGNWYSVACGLGGIVPWHQARSSLNQVFWNNVLRFENGTRGAVNGMRPSGLVDESCMQSKEVWTGTTYAAAACVVTCVKKKPFLVIPNCQG